MGRGGSCVASPRLPASHLRHATPIGNIDAGTIPRFRLIAYVSLSSALHGKPAMPFCYDCIAATSCCCWIRITVACSSSIRLVDSSAAHCFERAWPLAIFFPSQSFLLWVFSLYCLDPVTGFITWCGFAALCAHPEPQLLPVLGTRTRTAEPGNVGPENPMVVSRTGALECSWSFLSGRNETWVCK